MTTTFYTQMSHSPTNTREFLSWTAKEAHHEVHQYLLRRNKLEPSHPFPLADIPALDEKVM